MPITYEQAGDVVDAMVRKIINKTHHDLKVAEATVSCVFANTDSEDGHAVKLHGYPCAAVVRKTNLKQRVQGMADAEITISAQWWADHSEAERTALLDHELTHLVVQRDKDKQIKTDDIGRPKLVMRLHDWEIGGFKEIAERHAENAPEVQQAKHFNQCFGQLIFDWALNRKAVG